jgi:cyclophilin family peptidyl-prolyl cis-trans isomerase/protein-disulfide isomerase
MLKKLLPFILLSAILLTGCGPASPSSLPASGAPMDCKVVSLVPTPKPAVLAVIPPVSPSDHILGAKDALVTIVEYSDYQCPYCSLLAPVLMDLVKKYPNDLRLVYRFFPLPGHSNSSIAAYAAEAAGRQGKFFEFSEFLFANQSKWGGLSTRDAEAWFVAQADSFALDAEKFKADINSDSVHQVVDTSFKSAMDAKVPGTPFLLVNNIEQPQMDINALSEQVELYKLNQRAYKTCPPVVIDPKKQYEATLKTEKGNIVIKLFADKAPLAVNNFVFLARAGWFNNTTFHKVVKNLLAQGGDPSGSGLGGPGYQFNNENSAAVFNRGGLLVMDNSGPNTNASQFFITFAQAPNRNGTYTQFGEVLSGLDVAQNLTPREPKSAGAPLPPGDKLLSVEISEK